MVLQRQLNRRLDQLFVVTHDEEYWTQVRHLPPMYIPNQPEHRVLKALFGEADKRGDFEACCFIEVDGQNILGLIQRKNIYYDYAPYYISGKDKTTRDRFASWLRYRCGQQLATEAHTHGNTTEVISRDTSDV
jgi:hypothetical protein